MRLRHKAIALFLGCALLPAATVGVGAYHVARAVIAAAVGDELALAARDTLEALEGRLAEAADQLETWSGLHVMQDVLLRDAGGEVRDELAELRGRHPFFAELLVTDDAGTVVAATRPENVGKDLSADATVARARAGDRYQGGVGASGLAPGTALTMAVPVRAKYDGTTIVGVLLGVVDWDQVRRELAAVPLAGAAQDAGRLLELRSRADGALLYGTATVAASGRDGFLVRAAASGTHGALADPGWEMDTLVADDVAFASADRLRGQVVWLGALACLAAVLAGLLAAAHGVRPLARMIGAMDRLARGDTGTPVPELGRRDEIGGMAAALEVFRETARDRARKEERIAHLAHHDALTGLPNRALLVEQLARALRAGGPLAVLCLDLDRFKQVNDTLGHPLGDALLRAVASRLEGCVREGDTVARLGGDEFAVVQAAPAGPEDAAALAWRLVEALSAPYELLGHQVVVGASAGIALAPGHGTDPDELLKRADMALYRAKAEARGTFRSFEPGMDARLQARRLLELDLRKALAAGELELHYQPLVDLRSGAVTALEALLRWRHPARGLVPPAEFVPLAEEIGLIVPIGEWVLTRACADAAAWPGGVRVAVNLSAAQFRGRELVAAVVGALAASGLPPSRLELEITETVLLRDGEATLATLKELRALGVRIAMDDFGTGYSSLGYLRSFPFDKIKIDRCFVRDLGASADCEAIVRAVTGLGGSLGIATTAEGVETAAQLERLRAEGCDEAQGFHLGRPVPADQVADLLAGRRPDPGPRAAAA